MSNYRLALAQRFAPRIPNTADSYEPAQGGGRLAYARALNRFGPRRARVGKDTELYLNPATLVTYYRQIFDADPTIWTIGFIIYSVGQRLADLRMVAQDVENVGGGSLQLRLELERRVEDWQGMVMDFARTLRAQNDPEEDADALASELARRLFVEFPQDEGLWDYEAGGSVLPPPRGLIWELGTLANQVWAMWHPIAWVMDDPDEPWWSWMPVAIAAGWVSAINDVQEVVNNEPTQGPGWGAQLGTAAEQTEAKAVELSEKASEVLDSAIAYATGGAAIVLLGLGLLVLGRRG